MYTHTHTHTHTHRHLYVCTIYRFQIVTNSFFWHKYCNYNLSITKHYICEALSILEDVFLLIRLGLPVRQVKIILTLKHILCFNNGELVADLQMCQDITASKALPTLFPLTVMSLFSGLVIFMHQNEAENFSPIPSTYSNALMLIFHTSGIKLCCKGYFSSTVFSKNCLPIDYAIYNTCYYYLRHNRCSTNKINISFKRGELSGIPWQSRGQDSVISLSGAWVQPLVRELRSHKLRSTARGEKEGAFLIVLTRKCGGTVYSHKTLNLCFARHICKYLLTCVVV